MLRKLDQVADRLHKLRGHVCQALRGRLQTAACSVVSSWRHARSGVSMGAERAPRQQQRATRRPARSARPVRRSVPWRRIQRELDLTAQSGGGRNACISSRGRAQAPGQAVPGSALIDQQRPRDQHQPPSEPLLRVGRGKVILRTADRLLRCSAARRRQSLWNCCSPARILCTPLRRRSKRVMTELAVVRDRCESPSCRLARGGTSSGRRRV